MEHFKIGNKYYCKGDFKLGTACGKCYKCKNQKEINNIEVIDTDVSQLERLKALLQDKIDYLECISKLHVSYQFTLTEIDQIKSQINNLKNS